MRRYENHQDEATFASVARRTSACVRNGAAVGHGQEHTSKHI
jgi:hypothetical protein